MSAAAVDFGYRQPCGCRRCVVGRQQRADGHASALQMLYSIGMTDSDEAVRVLKIQQSALDERAELESDHRWPDHH